MFVIVVFVGFAAFLFGLIEHGNENQSMISSSVSEMGIPLNRLIPEGTYIYIYTVYIYMYYIIIQIFFASDKKIHRVSRVVVEIRPNHRFQY